MDVHNRTRHERRLALAWDKVARVMGKDALAMLGDPPDMANLTPEWWQQATRAQQDAIRPVLEDVYISQAVALVGTLAFDFGMESVNIAAASWAMDYAFDLVAGLNRTTRAGLQSAISGWFRGAVTREELEARIARLLGVSRAERIAITEVTRAAAEGERQVEKEAAAMGITLRPIWETNNDELVCPICGPRHGKPITGGVYPPAHVSCRCWVNHEVVQ